MKIGIISGHNIPSLFKNPDCIHVETIYGEVSLYHTTYFDYDIFFLNRHGAESNVPPHKIEHRANIQALSATNIDCIISLGTVGSMKTSINPGEIVIPHDFIDFTKSRTLSFFDNKRIHVDMSAPFCPHLREILHQSCKSNRNVIFHSKGIYLTTEGPRLETPAEILFFSTIGDVVGMTIGQETILAREKGICYAALCVVCNMAAGLQHQLPAQEITRIYKEKEPLVAQILTSAISKMTNKKTCLCGYTLHEA